MISRKFAYADDLALLHSSGNWKDLEGTLSQDMSTLSAYLQTWRLKLSHTKTVTAAFHLNNREAKHELKVYNNGRLLPFCPTPTYLGVKLDRSLTFRHHLVALRKKLSSRVILLRRLVGSGWGAGAKTLRIAALSLVYSTAEYFAPVWCRSSHTRFIYSVLKDTLHIVTGCLRPTPTYHLPIFSGIQPAKICRMGVTLSLAYRGSLDPRRRRCRRLKGIHSRPDTNRTGAEGLSFCYPRLLHCLDQMLAVMLLSQYRVSSSKTVRPRAPCGARCMGHIVSTWSAVCSEAPHSQFGEGARPHLCMDE